MTKRIRSLAVVAISALMAVSLVAQEHGGPQGRMNQTFTERYGQRLNLTDGQKKEIDALDAKFQKDNAEFLGGYQKTMAEFREARQANDTARVDALRPKVDGLRVEMTSLRSAHEAHIAKTFNDAQNAEWKKIAEERDARMKEQRQRQP